MDEKWYYVDAGERRGPVEISLINELIENSTLGEDDFIWRKGFENWAKIKDVEEFQHVDEEIVSEEELPGVIGGKELNLSNLAKDGNCIFIKIGVDRGGQAVEYGPYSLNVITKLFKENRINAKTLIFIRGMEDWTLLADFLDFSEIFEDAPPPIEEADRRLNNRKPFIARMYLESNQKVYVGVCRDISIGGMQVLADQVPSNIGEIISINVHPENTEHHFVAGGEIVRILEGNQGFSFRFTDLNDDAKEAIQKYLTND